MRAYEPSESRPPQAVLWDSFGERWLGFTEPTAVLQAWRSEDVLAALEQAAQAAQQTGLWAVGFLGYEAAPAFDQRLRVQPGAAAIGLPLLWFGLYPEAHELRGLPAAAAGRGHPLSGLAWQPSVSRQRCPWMLSSSPKSPSGCSVSNAEGCSREKAQNPVGSGLLIVSVVNAERA